MSEGKSRINTEDLQQKNSRTLPHRSNDTTSHNTIPISSHRPIRDDRWTRFVADREVEQENKFASGSVFQSTQFTQKLLGKNSQLTPGTKEDQQQSRNSRRQFWENELARNNKIKTPNKSQNLLPDVASPRVSKHGEPSPRNPQNFRQSSSLPRIIQSKKGEEFSHEEKTISPFVRKVTESIEGQSKSKKNISIKSRSFSRFNSFNGNANDSQAEKSKTDAEAHSRSSRVSSIRRISMQPERTLTAEEKNLLCKFIFKDCIGYTHQWHGPYGRNIVTYLDYIASGRPLKCIEKYIKTHVLPTYGNVHSENSYLAKQSTILQKEAREIIREACNCNDDDRIVFVGTGATAAINKLVGILELGGTVFIGPFEHHSNILPWKTGKWKVIRIKQTEHGLLDTDQLAVQLVAAKKPVVGCFSAASNVTGIITNTDVVSELMHRYNAYCFWDFACAAPYLETNMNPLKKSYHVADPFKDAIMMSPHKFIGGPATPGILIAKKWCFKKKTPHAPGGGTVLFVRRDQETYYNNPEIREEGGTPGIIECIRAGLVFKLKMTFGHKYIMEREELFMRRAKLFLSKLSNLVILGNMNIARLPVVPMIFYNEYCGKLIHHDFMALILSDVFGLETRSGCACAGPYTLDLMGISENTAKKYEKILTRQPDVVPGEPPLDPQLDYHRNMIYKPGYVRINIPFFLSENCFQFVLKSLQMVSEFGWTLLPQYNFDRHTGKWSHKDPNPKFKQSHLLNAFFDVNGVKVKKSPKNSKSAPSNKKGISSSSESDTDDSENLFSDPPDFNYDEILRRAEIIFEDAISGRHDEADQRRNFEEEDEKLRWFMLPSEAADLIHERPLPFSPPDTLPFMPGALARKIGANPRGHPGRSASMDKLFILEY